MVEIWTCEHRDHTLSQSCYLLNMTLKSAVKFSLCLVKTKSSYMKLMMKWIIQPWLISVFVHSSLYCDVSLLQLWEVYNERRCVRTYLGHREAVRDVCFNNPGTKFLSCSYDRYCKLWDTETGLSLFCYHSLASRPSSMTVGDSRWPLYCLSSPLLPVLWHLLQLNVATPTPLFYVVHPLSFGSSLVT